MNKLKETITVRANIEVTPEAIQAVVANAKAVAGRDERGMYRVDPADKLNEMISLFLQKHDFEGFVKNAENYN
jgi:hypothetical protein